MKNTLLPWPIADTGEEKFFGYITGMGIADAERAFDEAAPVYVEFCYGDEVKRYVLPPDEKLYAELNKWLMRQLVLVARGVSIGHKLWVKKTENGWSAIEP